MTSSIRAIAALFLLMILIGCGQSGPLFIPGDPSEIEVQSEPRGAAEEDEDDEESAGTP